MSIPYQLRTCPCYALNATDDGIISIVNFLRIVSEIFASCTQGEGGQFFLFQFKILETFAPKIFQILCEEVVWF